MDPDYILALMRNRRSIRKFKEDPVPDELIDKILEAARWCQSASNRQPWRFIVIKKKELIKDLKECTTYGKFLDQAPVVIAVVGDKGKAPKWYLHDTCMASHQICLMAWALGLGTCWIGSMDREKGAELLNLGKKEFLTTILPIGYPASIPSPSTRNKLEKIVTKVE
ncbi:MAG: nitroreductase family protein [Candidatus Hodarchaeota archaeon]